MQTKAQLQDELQDRFAALKDADKDWDMVFLGRCFDDCKRDEVVAKWLVRPKAPKCLHAYALTRRGAQKFLDGLLPMTDNT